MKHDIQKYIEEQEATDISYVKVGNGSRKLIVNFASNHHNGFEGKTSLMKLKYERNNFDVLYLRNQFNWYLGALKGIGKSINDTFTFLKKEFSKYDTILCTGISAGGYASILFGSILKVNEVIAIDSQTDLEYCIDNLIGTPDYLDGLQEQKGRYSLTWSKYNKVAGLLNNNVSYNVFYQGDDNFKNDHDALILHGDYHYDLIKDFPTVQKFNKRNYLMKIW